MNELLVWPLCRVHGTHAFRDLPGPVRWRRERHGPERHPETLIELPTGARVILRWLVGELDPWTADRPILGDFMLLLLGDPTWADRRHEVLAEVLRQYRLHAEHVTVDVPEPLPTQLDAPRSTSAATTTSDALLRAAGWYPGRQEPVDALVETYTAAGYAAQQGFATFIEFLRSYDGLSLTWRDSDGVQDEVWIDGLRAVHVVDVEVAQIWAQTAGTPLWPVGEAMRRHAVLLADASRGLYGVYPPSVMFLGPLQEAIARLVSDQSVVWVKDLY